MAISSRSRKILWSRAHDRCALCRTPLTRDRADGSIDVVGVEAHIIARSVGGPRGRSTGATDIDGYDNLLLVCPNDHQRIDQDPEWFTVERLRGIKAAHERWAASHYDPAPADTPSPPDQLVELNEAQHGEDVWHVVAGAGAYFLENEVSREDQTGRELAAEFLQVAHDYGEIATDVQAIGPQAEHDAGESLAGEVGRLRANGLAVWVGRSDVDIGPVTDPVRVPAAVIVVRPRS